MGFNEKTLHSLEFNKICEMLASYAPTEGSKVMAQMLMPSTDIDTVLVRQKRTTDAKRLCDAKGMPTFGGVRDVSASCERAEKGAIFKQLLLVIGKHIEYIQLVILVAKQQILVLRMYIYQFAAQFLEQRSADGGIVHKVASAACCRQFATNDALDSIIFKFILFKEFLKRKRGDVEMSLNDTFVCSFAHLARIGAFAQKHGYCTQ